MQIFSAVSSIGHSFYDLCNSDAFLLLHKKPFRHENAYRCFEKSILITHMRRITLMSSQIFPVRAVEEESWERPYESCKLFELLNARS